MYAIFYAIGIAIASKLNLGIKINQIQTIYLVAVILAMVQLFVGKLPVFNLIANTMLPTLAVLSLSIVIKDFKIDRSYGYPLVAAGILVIIAVQFLLHGVFLGLVNGQLLDAEAITNLYLYSQETTPIDDELLNSNLIRPELDLSSVPQAATNFSSILVDAVPSMSTEPTRFANGSQFDLVKGFFGLV